MTQPNVATDTLKDLSAHLVHATNQQGAAPEVSETKQKLIQQLSNIIGSLKMPAAVEMGRVKTKRVIIEGNTITGCIRFMPKTTDRFGRGEGVVKNTSVYITGPDGEIGLHAQTTCNEKDNKTAIWCIDMNPATSEKDSNIQLYRSSLDDGTKIFNPALDEEALTGAINMLSQFNKARNIQIIPTRENEAARVQLAIARMVKSTLVNKE